MKDIVKSEDEGVDVEYVSEDPPEEIQMNPHFRSFRKIFELFTITEAVRSQMDFYFAIST